MKEATGELNMTVVTVVAIAAVGAFFYLVIWPSIRANLEAQVHCSSAVQCTKCNADNSDCECKYYETAKSGEQVLKGPIHCDRSAKGGNKK